jgi:replication factor C subunit 3/5
MLCNNISRVLDAVRSRTLPVRVAAPSEADICDLLQHVAEKEKITLPAEFAARVGAPLRAAPRRARGPA